MGARMVPANGQTTKTKKNLLYVILVGKTFHLITNIYIRVQFLFSKRGACFYWVPCFYWDIYGILHVVVAVTDVEHIYRAIYMI